MEIIRYTSPYRIKQFLINKINFREFMRSTDEKLNDERNHTWTKDLTKDISIKIIIPDIEIMNEAKIDRIGEDYK